MKVETASILCTWELYFHLFPFLETHVNYHHFCIKTGCYMSVSAASSPYILALAFSPERFSAYLIMPSLQYYARVSYREPPASGPLQKAVDRLASCTPYPTFVHGTTDLQCSSAAAWILRCHVICVSPTGAASSKHDRLPTSFSFESPLHACPSCQTYMQHRTAFHVDV